MVKKKRWRICLSGFTELMERLRASRLMRSAPIAPSTRLHAPSANGGSVRFSCAQNASVVCVSADFVAGWDQLVFSFNLKLGMSIPNTHSTCTRVFIDLLCLTTG
eukprot:m.59456 g.59456  ORF g.59456 m.59456 type:complete len:105 (-) comp17337_c0_seq3:2198-2512(-)